MLYMLWEYDVGGTFASNATDEGHSLLFKRSIDGGKTFGETVMLYHAERRCSIYPHLETNENNVYVMWSDGDKISFRASNDTGTSFGNSITLGEGILGNIGVPSPLIDGGQIISARTDEIHETTNDNKVNVYAA